MFNFVNKNKKIASSFCGHYQKVDQCFENLEEFFRILFSGNADRHKLESAKIAVGHCEAGADKELRSAIFAMSEAYLPATRKSLIHLLLSMDEIANHCESIADQVFLENIVLPEVLHDDILKVLELTQEQLNLLCKAIDMMLNDFGKISKDRKILDDVRMDEGSVDKIEDLLRTRIFAMDISLCEKVYYRDLVLDICQLSNIIEDAADELQMILIEREG